MPICVAAQKTCMNTEVMDYFWLLDKPRMGAFPHADFAIFPVMI